MSRNLSSSGARWFAVAAFAAVAISIAIGQVIHGGVSISDPIMDLRYGVGYLYSRMDAVEKQLKEEVQARKALEKEIAELKKERATKSTVKPSTDK